VVIRRNLVLDKCPPAGHCSGFSAFGSNSLLLEEDVFNHNGWLHAARPAAKGKIGIASLGSHNTYFGTCRDVVMRGNMFLRSSSIGSKWTSSEGGARTRAKTPALLKGIIRCGHCGNSMGITFTRRNGKLYRYYLCIHASKNGYASCPVKSVAAGEMEEAVMGQLRAVFRSSDLIAKTYRAARSKEAAELERLRAEKGGIEDRLRVLKEMPAGLKRGGRNRVSNGNAATAELARIRDEITETENRLSAAARDLQLREAAEITERDVIDALQGIEPIWDELFPAEQARIVQLLVDSVVVNPDGLEVCVRSNGLRSLITELNGAVSDAQERSSES